MNVFMLKIKTYFEGFEHPQITTELYSTKESAIKEVQRYKAKEIFNGKAYSVYDTKDKVFEITKEVVFQ